MSRLRFVAVAMITAAILMGTFGAAEAASLAAPVADGQLTTAAKIVAVNNASSRAVQFGAPAPDAAGFVHPGILEDQSQLDYAKSQLLTGSEPWKSTYAATNTNLAADGQAFGSLTYTPHPVATLACTGSSRADCQKMIDDAVAAYTQALMFYYQVDSGSSQHATNAVSILNGWAHTLQTVSGTQVVLETGWAGSMFARAAEIMRYTYSPPPGQPVLDIPAISGLFDRFVTLDNGPYGQLAYAASNGNWELAGAEAKISIGVFQDNRATFNDGVAVWRARVPAYIYESTDNEGSGKPVAPPHGLYDDPAKLTCFWLGSGTPTASCKVPTAAAGFSYVNGLTQETCRDVSHAQLGLEAIVNGAETARIQGIDLYGEQSKRIVDAYEFAANYDTTFVNTKTWPAQPCAGRPGSAVGVSGDGTGGVGFHRGWEIAYNEYANRLSVPMPQTATFIAQSERPSTDPKAFQHIAWEALTNAGAPSPGCVQPDLRSGQATVTVSLPADGSYALWSRVRSATDGSASYLLSVDGACPVGVTGSALSVNTWAWVKAGSPLTLSAGTHTLVLTGVSQALTVDSLMLSDDQTCQPVDTGANCTNPAAPPVTPAAPVASLSAPSEGDSVLGQVTIQAAAGDPSTVDHVEFWLDGAKIGTAATAPYSFAWDTTSVANGVHQLQAIAVDMAGATGRSALTSVQVTNPVVTPPPVPAPSVPANVTAAATSPPAVQLTWDSANSGDGVTGYTLSRDGVVLAQLGPVTSYTDTAVSASSTYRYTLTASNAAGSVSAASAPASVTTPAPPDTTAPTTPADLKATANSASQVSLTWSAATDNLGVTGYALSRNGTFLAQLGNVTSYTDTSVTSSTAYSFTISANDIAGNTSAASAATTVTTPAEPDTAAPTPPSNVLANALSATQIKIDWTAATDNVQVTGYVLSRNGLFLARLGSITTYTDSTVTANTAYSYTLTASDAAGNTSPASAAASVTTPAAPDTTPPSTPSTLTATAASSYQVNLAWTAATDNVGVTGYRVSRGGVLLTTVSALTYADTSVQPASAYSYAVAPIDAAGNVGVAKAASVTTAADAVPLSSGFAASYFANTSLAGPAVIRLDPTVNFDWGTGAPAAGIPADNFSARWTGKVKAPSSGTYTFSTQADNNARLWINGKLLIDQWTGSPATKSAAIALTAGVSYNVRLEYVERTGSALMRLSWSGPGVAKAIVPAAVVTSGSDGLIGSYFSNSGLIGNPTLVRPDSNVAFSWGTAAPDPLLPADNFSVRWAGKVLAPTSGAFTFYTDSSGGGVRLWVNGQLVVDNWTNHPLTTNSGTLSLTAGTWYSVRMEYQNVSGAATSALSWSTGTGAKTVIPTVLLRDR